MLTLPSKSADPIGSFTLGYEHLDRLPANLSAGRFALILANLEHGFVGNSFHISVAEGVGSEAGGAHGLGFRYTFLNLGADGAVIHQVPILDDLRSVIDRDLWSLELVVGIEMSDAQFRHLAGGSGDRSLMTLAAGRGVVERA